MSLKLRQIKVAVASAGTPKVFSTTTLKIQSAIITADPNNTGKVYIGDENIDASTRLGAPIDANETIELEATEYLGTHELIDLNQYYVDATTSGDSVIVSYYERIKDGGEIIFENSKSLLFDGVDEYVQLGTDSSLDITSSLSVFFWVKGAANQLSKSPLSKWSGAGNLRTWLFLTPDPASGKMRVYVDEDGGGVRKVYETSMDVMDDTWHHIGFTYTGDTLTVYVDGAEDTSVNKIEDDTMTNLFSSAHETVMGRFSGGSGPTGYFTGNLDEVSIWNKELTSSEVSELYNSGVALNLSSHSASGNLVSWWRNGDAAGDLFPTIQDQIGSNDGTMTNMESGDIVEDAP